MNARVSWNIPTIKLNLSWEYQISRKAKTRWLETAKLWRFWGSLWGLKPNSFRQDAITVIYHGMLPENTTKLIYKSYFLRKSYQNYTKYDIFHSKKRLFFLYRILKSNYTEYVIWVAWVVSSDWLESSHINRALPRRRDILQYPQYCKIFLLC